LQSVVDDSKREMVEQQLLRRIFLLPDIDHDIDCDIDTHGNMDDANIAVKVGRVNCSRVLEKPVIAFSSPQNHPFMMFRR
jgi:hypothetical protein